MILAYKHQTDAANADSHVHLLCWNLHDGQKLPSEVGYAALAPTVITKDEVLVKQISANGQPALK